MTTVLSIFLLIQLLPLQSASAQTGLRMPPVRFPGTSLQNAAPRTYSFVYPYSLRFTEYPSSFTYTSVFDSSMSFVTLKRLFRGTPVEHERYYLFPDFISARSLYNKQDQWREFLGGNVTALKGGRGSSQGLVFRTGKIKSEAFRKAFGGDDISLTINGNIDIDGTYKNEKRSSKKIASDRQPNNNFQMKMKQNFTVTGKIGEKIIVDVAQDSENEFEFQNAVKLQYNNDEDGIIKRIDAGNVNLSLPGTNFVTMSQSNAGLFGLKADMQLGPLSLTAIASMEKGQKNKLSLSGEGKEQIIEIEDYDYKKATYFFLDTLYRNEFTNYAPNGAHIVDPLNIITTIQIYKSDVQYESQPGAFQAWAAADLSQGTPVNADNETVKRYFLRLEPIKDYYVNRELGYIQMSVSLRESEILAVAYRDSSGRVFGDLQATETAQTGIPVLKLIKAQAPLPSFETWDLEWKNVYNIGIPDITDDEFAQNFKVKIFYKDPSGQPKESALVNGAAQSFLHIFGLDDIDLNGARIPDNKIDNNPNIINKSRGEIIFPNLRPFDPQPGTGPASDLWGGEEGDEYRYSAVYDTTKRDYISNTSKFKIEITSSRRSPKFELGFNVIEGTEEIICNGAKLIKDVDYTIDYFSGTLVLTSDRATDPNAQVDIGYESQRMFAPDKKVLLGTRAEYTLWEQDNQRSFIGATLLYLSRTSLDQRIRLGKEAPMSNFVWDVNTSLGYSSDKVTRYLNKLPLLDMTGASSIKFEGEIAEITPNPNTLNSESTGDYNGVAYLDDFEGAKRKISLGVLRKHWLASSIPSPSAQPDTVNYYLENKGSLVWYNPYNKVPIQDIWPDKEVTTNFGGQTGTDVLTFDFIPNDTLPDPRTSWGGIQRGLNTGYYDQTDSRFLEIWVKSFPDETAPEYLTLHIELGQISEDIIPNGEWDTEDYKPDGGIRDTNLEPDKEDTGLDHMFGDDPPRLFYPHDGTAAAVLDTVGGVPVLRATLYDFWDLDNDRVKDANEPWSYDDYTYSDKNPYKLRYDVSEEDDGGTINGYEDNKDDGSIRYPDSEDMNGNSSIDTRNNYFKYSVSLDPNSSDARFIASETEKGWRLYRIPLIQGDEIESPDWSRIENARIWVNGVTRRSYLQIAEMELVSNEWKYHGKMAAGDSLYTLSETDTTLSIAVTNTHENPDYEPPKGVEGVIDPTLKIRSKEQSLVLQLNDLGSGERVIAKKRFYEPQNLIQYKKLKMFVHGGDANEQIPQGEIEFFLRLGSDTQDEIYYEIMLPEVEPGWIGNDIEIAFEDLSAIKLEKELLAQDTISRDLSPYTIFIKGNPSLRNIRWLIAGVRNKGPQSWTGQIWMDELRLSDVHKEKGMAMRAKAILTVGDLLSVNGQYDRKDADFHTINETSTGEGATIEGYNANINLNIDRLMPSHWGIKVPITGRIARTTSTPKYLPGSDILLNEKTAGDSVLAASQTINETKSVGLRFNKTVKSRSFLGRFLLDPVSGNVNYSGTNSQNPRTGTSDGETYNGSFQYDLTFSDRNSFKLLKWLGTDGLLKKLANTEFYLPSKINFKLDGNDVEQQSKTVGGVTSLVDRATFSKSYAASWSPVKPVSMDYSLSNNYDLNADSTAGWYDILGELAEESLVAKTQRINASFTPKLSAWLTANFKYTTDYGYNYNPQMASTGSGKSAKVNTSINVTSKLDPQKLVQSFAKKSAPAGGAANRRQASTRRKPAARATDTDTPKEAEKEEKTGGFSLGSLLAGVGKGVSIIDPVSITYRKTNSVTTFGILSMPVLKFQLGFQEDPGVPISQNLTSDRSRSQASSTVSVRSGLKFTRQLNATMDYQFSDTKTISTQSSQSVSKSIFMIGEYEAIPMPNWTVRWSGIEKLFFFEPFLTSFTLNHSYSGDMAETWNESVKTQTKYTINFRPLIGFDITFKNGITSNFKYSATEMVTLQTAFGKSISKDVGSDMTFALSYKKRGGIKIPFLKGKKLDNNIDFTLNASVSNQSKLQKAEAGKKFQVIMETKNWSIKPGMTYSFSRNVRGGVHFELGERKNSRTGTTKFTAFGINARISLSG
ncbi:cell surface protein SprA [bacterium]|nr:cell surface protein SprA [bacterium]